MYLNFDAYVADNYERQRRNCFMNEYMMWAKSDFPHLPFVLPKFEYVYQPSNNKYIYMFQSLRAHIKETNQIQMIEFMLCQGKIMRN